ncbi:GroES-like protein [Endogone sp. FLAS-F59071]|nr:GroES-like protein [Endogone sp. FLAS-F59071]|eukprot:RUS15654.1 GroES-like protein [Endogone sp. FLAS-F59071]
MVKALIVKTQGGEFELGEWERPVPTGHEILIKNVVVALNPVDWKQIKYNIAVPQWPVVVGADTAGIVEEVGPEVTDFQPGDRVFSYSKIGSNNYGTFAEYSLILDNVSSKIPPNLSFEEAATLPLGVLTSAVALYHELKLARPREHQTFFRPEYILIWGGSSSTGTYAIQLAKLSGYTVITTASPHNTEYLQSLGADIVLDRNDPDIVANIRKITSGKLRYAYDTVSSNTAELAAQALDQDRKTYLSVIAGSPAGNYPKVELRQTVTGVIYNDAGEFGHDFYQELYGLLEAGLIRPNRYEVLPNGLAGIPEGEARLAAGKVSGVKLVVRVAETP